MNVADELERLIEQDAVWETDEFRRCADRLATAADEPAVSLARCLDNLRHHLDGLTVTDRLRRDVEGIVYPRLWKVVESLRDDLPAGEQMNRVRALDQRLTDLFGSSGVAGASGRPGPYGQGPAQDPRGVAQADGAG